MIHVEKEPSWSETEEELFYHDLLEKLGFDGNASGNILQTRERLGLKELVDNRFVPSRIASIEIVLKMIGYDVDLYDEIKINDYERNAYRKIVYTILHDLGEKHGIVVEKVYNHFQFAIDIKKQLPLSVIDYNDIAFITSTKIKKERWDTCAYCGKEIRTPYDVIPFKNVYCDDACEELHGQFLSFKLRHAARLNEHDMKWYVRFPLRMYNAYYYRDVAMNDFIDEIQFLAGANYDGNSSKISFRQLLFYAYFLAARKSGNYISLFDMERGLIKEERWRGIKEIIMERGPPDRIGAIHSVFRSCMKKIDAHRVLPGERVSQIDAIFEKMDIEREAIDPSCTPDTVAKTTIAVLLDRIDPVLKKYASRVLKSINITPSTVYKREGVVMEWIERCLQNDEPVVVQQPESSPPDRAVDIEQVKADLREEMRREFTKMIGIGHPGDDDFVIDASPSTIIPKKKVKKYNLIFVDLNNVAIYAKNEDIPFTMESFLKRLYFIISMRDTSRYNEDNFIAYMYCSAHLKHLKDTLVNFASKVNDPNLQRFPNVFKWFVVGVHKFENGEDKFQDVDTYLVAKAIEEILKLDGEIKRLYVVSGDKDMLPVLSVAYNNAVPVTVIAHEGSIGSEIHANCDEVVYL